MTDQIPVFLAFGVLIGLTTICFGFGGGFVVVPVVYGVLRASSATRADAMHVAIATSAAVMVVNATSATLAQRGTGRIRAAYIWPLVAFIAVGATGGALLSGHIGDALLHRLFIAYIGVTILDSVLRRGFLTTRPGSPPSRLSRSAMTVGGVAIGAIASMLGVGGSVMTVPLLRRRGLAMAEAVAMANPLSIPIALIGTVIYAWATGAPGRAGPGQVGYIDLGAGAALLTGSLPTIALARRVVSRLPDQVYAATYIGLLTLVAVAMIA